MTRRSCPLRVGLQAPVTGDIGLAGGVDSLGPTVRELVGRSDRV